MSTRTPDLSLIVLTSHTKRDPGNPVCLNAEQWVSILVLADKYEMTLLRNTAVQKLQVAHPRLNPVKQIAIARKYCCNELVEEPFEMLGAREEVLSREEIAQLPLEDLHGLIVRREALQRENAKPTSGQCVNCTKTLQLSIGYCDSCRKCNSCGLGSPSPPPIQGRRNLFGGFNPSAN